MKLYTLEAFRNAILKESFYQRNANDVTGSERDCEWKAEVRRARSWSAMFLAICGLPSAWRWIEIATNDGMTP